MQMQAKWWNRRWTAIDILFEAEQALLQARLLSQTTSRQFSLVYTQSNPALGYCEGGKTPRWSFTRPKVPHFNSYNNGTPRKLIPIASTSRNDCFFQAHWDRTRHGIPPATLYIGSRSHRLSGLHCPVPPGCHARGHSVQLGCGPPALGAGTHAIWRTCP
ncbi:hypothetical protein BC828DRAFT_143486 [Blastocladiella britannica]|nr:hypothetical protein BC828DRAFT_143486 [Blastocladiella britannica]